MEKPDQPESEVDNPTETPENTKFSDLNEDQEASSKILNKQGQDISSMINISHLKASDQTWDQLKIPDDLKNNLITKGFKGPSRIQFQVMTLLNSLKDSGKISDIVAQSQNGSGKTLSFLVPTLSACTKNHAAKSNKVSPQVVILADTNELIHQTYKIINLIKPEWVKADYHTKDKNADNDVNLHILISTVDSFTFLLTKQKVALDCLKMFVIDEADKIILNDSGRKNLPNVIKQISKDVIIGLFSATLPDKCIQILEALKRDYNRIVVENKTDLSLKNLKHFWVRCHRGQKLSFIDKFLKKVNVGNVIIFVNSRSFADQFARSLNANGHKSEILTGDMLIADRVRILDDFKSGKIKVLLTTNLLSRGIDARKVSLVINLDMPYTHKENSQKGQDNRDKIDLETYLHRCGRTARFGDMGVALNIIEDERGQNDLKSIETEYGIQMHEVTLDNFEQVVAQNVDNFAFNEEKRKTLEENI